MDGIAGYVLVVALTLASVAHCTFTVEFNSAKAKSSKNSAPDISLSAPIRSDIVKALTNDKRFTALANAVAIAGLVPSLMSGGSFITLFAPTNDAFRALPLRVLNDLIANPDKMKKFLLGHLVYGKIAGVDIRSGELRFENGEVGKVTVTRGGVTIGRALVVQTDITTLNGVIHAIDRVIEHEPPPSLGKLLSEDGRFSIFMRAATNAGLMHILESSEPHTVFAPTNAAFRSLPPGVLEKVMSSQKKSKRVVLSHLVSGKIMGADLQRGDQRVVSGPVSRMVVARSTGRKATARVVQADIPAANGVVHAIDTVI